jgi:hypothetical protein
VRLNAVPLAAGRGSREAVNLYLQREQLDGEHIVQLLARADAEAWARARETRPMNI